MIPNVNTANIENGLRIPYIHEMTVFGLHVYQVPLRILDSIFVSLGIFHMIPNGNTANVKKGLRIPHIHDMTVWLHVYQVPLRILDSISVIWVFST